MEREYKLIEELQKIYKKELNYKIYIDNYCNIGRTSIEIKDIYTVDNKIINKIQEYTDKYFVNVNYKKLGLILIINFDDRNSENLVSKNIQNNRI